jgi:hypothetical protein
LFVIMSYVYQAAFSVSTENLWVDRCVERGVGILRWAWGSRQSRVWRIIRAMNIGSAILVFLVLGCQTICCAESPAEAIIITAKPKFSTKDHFRDLIVSDGKSSYEIGWAAVFPFQRNVYFYPVSLNSRKTYTFTIIQEPFAVYDRTLLVPRLKRVEANGEVIFDAGICEVHKEKMAWKEVPIVYGLIQPKPGEPSATMERRQFPHRYEVSFGGCVVGLRSPKTKTIYVCEECKEAYAAWRSKNRAEK